MIEIGPNLSTVLQGVLWVAGICGGLAVLFWGMTK